MDKAPPQIFSKTRRKNRFLRAYFGKQDAAEAREPGAPLPDFLTELIAEDMVDRLTFVRHLPETTAHFGLGNLALARYYAEAGSRNFWTHFADEEKPFGSSEFDLITSINVADTINDLPGALLHIREALRPEGLAILTFPGAGSLPQLRNAITQAEIERPAARMHPLIDAQAGAQLLQRAGWADPVVDTFDVNVSYPSIDRLVADLRIHGLTNILASKAPMLTRRTWQRAREIFLEHAGEDGRVIETFSFLTLTGRRPKARF